MDTLFSNSFVFYGGGTLYLYNANKDKVAVYKQRTSIVGIKHIRYAGEDTLLVVSTHYVDYSLPLDVHYDMEYFHPDDVTIYRPSIISPYYLIYTRDLPRIINQRTTKVSSSAQLEDVAGLPL